MSSIVGSSPDSRSLKHKYFWVYPISPNREICLNCLPVAESQHNAPPGQARTRGG
jgi:hypothetical protein